MVTADPRTSRMQTIVDPQISVQDRWAIIAYIRALQVSQNSTINDLSPAMRAKLEGGAQ